MEVTTWLFSWLCNFLLETEQECQQWAETIKIIGFLFLALIVVWCLKELVSLIEFVQKGFCFLFYCVQTIWVVLPVCLIMYIQFGFCYQLCFLGLWCVVLCVKTLKRFPEFLRPCLDSGNQKNVFLVMLGIAVVVFVIQVVSFYILPILLVILVVPIVAYHWNQAGFEVVLQMMLNATTENKLMFFCVAVVALTYILYTLMSSFKQGLLHLFMLCVVTSVLAGYSAWHLCADVYDELQQRALGTILVTTALLCLNVKTQLAILFHGCFVVVIVVVMANAQLHRKYLYQWNSAWEQRVFIGFYLKLELVHELYGWYTRNQHQPTQNQLTDTNTAGCIRNKLVNYFKMQFQRGLKARFVPTEGWDVYLRAYRKYKIWLFQLCILYVYCFYMLCVSCLTHTDTGYHHDHNTLSDWLSGFRLEWGFMDLFAAGSQTCFVIPHSIKIEYNVKGTTVWQDAEFQYALFGRVTVKLSQKPYDYLTQWASENDSLFWMPFLPDSSTYWYTVEQFSARDFPQSLEFFVGWWAPQAANVTQARHNVCDACVTACVEQSEPICHAICDSVSRHVGELQCSAMASSFVQVAKQADDS